MAQDTLPNKAYKRLDKLGALAFLVGGDRRPTCYLAGPMRGYLDFSFPAFHAATAELRAAGWTVIELHEVGEPPVRNASLGVVGVEVQADGVLSRREGRAGLAEVCYADAVFLLPGWEKSVGAKLEVQVALAVEKRVFTLEDCAELVSA